MCFLPTQACDSFGIERRERFKKIKIFMTGGKKCYEQVY